jgi:hypothetical protein
MWGWGSGPGSDSPKGKQEKTKENRGGPNINKIYNNIQ